MKYTIILLLVVFTGFSSAAFAQDPSTKPESPATSCSRASLSGTYGFLHDGTDGNAVPISAAVSQITFDSTAGTFIVETTSSRNGVIVTFSATGIYTVGSNCTGTAFPTGHNPFSFVVTSTGFLAVEPINLTTGVSTEGFGVKRGSTTCTNATVEGSFGLEATGVFVAGAPVTGPVGFIGDLKFTVNQSGEGLISGHLAGSEGGTIFDFAGEPVTGSYSVAKNCTGTATITSKSLSEMNFSFVVVHVGKEMLAIETDADTVVSGTLRR
jgi:hypothetical protein